MKLIDPTISTGHSVRTTLACSDQFSTKVYFEHYPKPFNLHDCYRYCTGVQNASDDLRYSFDVDDILASGRSLHGSHHGIFLCVSLFFCRA